jgi:NADPH:quinone reductase-like Zn-dependent oxidoreductase
VKIIAAGLHRVVRSRAAGNHYSSGSLPHVPGIDGVGTTDDGKTIYFTSFGVGSMAEHVNVPRRSMMPVPEGVDPIQAAGIANPAMSSWAALKLRTSNLPKDFSVLIVGATSASGRVAVYLARALGAKRIIAAARNQAALESLGADENIVLADEPGKTDFSTIGEVDVILDYVYGPLAVHLLNSLKTTKPVDYIHIGSLSGDMEISLPGAVLRSKPLTIRGSGPGGWSTRDLAAVMPDLLEALKLVPEQPIKVVKLADVESEWNSAGSERVVFVP